MPKMIISAIVIATDERKKMQQETKKNVSQSWNNYVSQKERE